MFLLGGILLVAVQHLITNVHSQASSKLLPVNAREMTDRELQQLIKIAVAEPGTEIYLRVSHCFEKRGDFKKALLYLRRAEKIGQTEDSSD